MGTSHVVAAVAVAVRGAARRGPLRGLEEVYGVVGRLDHGADLLWQTFSNVVASF